MTFHAGIDGNYNVRKINEASSSRRASLNPGTVMSTVLTRRDSQPFVTLNGVDDSEVSERLMSMNKSKSGGSHEGRSCFAIVARFCRGMIGAVDNDLEDLEMQTVRYKPEGLDQLCRATKFTKKELQLMYRGFKQECPSGLVNEDTFKDIYAQFFPQGGKSGCDSSHYAHYVFNSFDTDHNGSITFEEFVTGLSVLSRGTLHEKLNWAFNLYDINGDGYITREEMLNIVSSIYEMMGKYSEPSLDEVTPTEHVERVFQKMDLNKDGVVTIEEFIDSCRRDETITKSMHVFDTIL